ncbi:MAG: hypothetical protein ACI31R_03480 [Bacilli bacterium]
MDSKKNDSNKQKQYDFYKDTKDKKEKVNKNISYDSYNSEKEHSKSANNSSEYNVYKTKKNKKSTFFYDAYKKEKDKYKILRESIKEGLGNYDNMLKRSRKEAISLLITLVIIISLSIFFIPKLGIFYFHGYFLLLMACILILAHSYKNIKDTKLFILVFILSIITIFFILSGMFNPYFIF